MLLIDLLKKKKVIFQAKINEKGGEKISVSLDRVSDNAFGSILSSFWWFFDSIYSSAAPFFCENGEWNVTLNGNQITKVNNKWSEQFPVGVIVKRKEIGK